MFAAGVCLSRLSPDPTARFRLCEKELSAHPLASSTQTTANRHEGVHLVPKGILTDRPAGRWLRPREAGSGSRPGRGAAPVSSPWLAQKLWRAHTGSPLPQAALSLGTLAEAAACPLHPGSLAETEGLTICRGEETEATGARGLTQALMWQRRCWGKPALPQGEPQEFLQSFPLSLCQIADPFGLHFLKGTKRSQEQELKISPG